MQKLPLPVGLEPTTYRLTAERATYCAMEACTIRELVILCLC